MGSSQAPTRAALLLHPRDGHDPAAAAAALASQKPSERRYLSHDELAALYGASDEEIEAVRSFAASHALVVDEVHAAGRLVMLSGAMADFAKAFHCAPAPQGGFIVTPPAELAPIVEGVFGLDELPRFERVNRAGLAVTQGATTPDAAPDTAPPARPFAQPETVAGRYRFPETTGEGETIAILLLGGGFFEDDLAEYFGGKVPRIEVVGIAGSGNDPAPRDAILQYLSDLESGRSPSASAEMQSWIWWTIEATVDIQLAGRFAPGASFVVYFAPNSELGKIAALSAIVSGGEHDPSVLSCSWGAREADLSPAFLAAFDRFCQLAALRGMSVCYSSGDKGANVKDGQPSADFPAASPHVLACGGTAVPEDATVPEKVWNESRGSLVLATGGGFSRYFPRPDWQRGVDPGADGQARRGVPDVAAKADYACGYQMRLAGCTIHGGGTSSAAPLWAGLLARLNQGLGVRVGWITPLLYGSDFEAYLNGITEGDNGAFQAAAGWNPCTGLGSPDGEALLQFLRG